MHPGARAVTADYDTFAWFYRKHWCAKYHPWAEKVLDRILVPRLERGAAVLDLACGVGTVTRSLASRGYYVTGVDRSAAMVEFARRDVPDAFFLQGDIRNFRMPLAFNGAVCTFDSLNHIVDPGELRGVFDNVFVSLLPRGVFAFDLNQEAVYRTRWGHTFAAVEDDSAFFVRGSYDETERLGRTDITMFREIEGEWKRFDSTFLQRCYDPGEVRHMLIEAGFGGIEVVDVPRDLGIPGNHGEGRLFFVAVKPERAIRRRAERSSIPAHSRAASGSRRRKALRVRREGETR